MPTIDIPEELVALLQPVLDHVEMFTATSRSGADQDFEAGELALMARVAAFEVGCLRQMLLSLDPTSRRIEVGGRTYRRMENPNMDSAYFAMRGSITVRRGLYRLENVKNGPTIVPMELRAGIVEGRLTPAAAQGIAAVGQGLPSREADAMCSRLGVLPYSRSEHFRGAVSIGERWGEIRDAVEDSLVERMEIPAETSAVSVAVDRVSLPMAEPRERTAQDIEKGIMKPINVAFRMAYSGVLTLYDVLGKPLGCVRYAYVPTSGAAMVEDALREDLRIILSRRPDLTLVTLADGAPDMQFILERATAGHSVKAAMVDFWHLLEKLAAAATAAGEVSKPTVARFREALLEADDAIYAIDTELQTWSLKFAPKGAPPEDTRPAIPDDLYAALTYVANNAEKMRYATVHRAGLPIGSGTVEATGKTIVETRMRRAGARWIESGAQPILALRALATSSGARWGDAMGHIIASYRAQVTLLPDKARKPAGSP